MVERIHVELGKRSYDIFVGPRLLQEAGEHIKPLLENDRVIIVTDESVARFHLHRLTGALEEAGITSRSIVLPPGEQTKSFDSFSRLVENILEQKPDRKTMLIALGGGVVGDITGFAASVVLRGIDFIQIPTTLLSQVDSSVGGKTAINSVHGKNLIGTFHQPRMVLADTSVLGTLPERQMLAGYAEILKYGLINRTHFYYWLEENGQKVLEGVEEKLKYAVSESCHAKAEIVARDEREAGVRALLNFGHTFAHAFEIETNYSDELLHGEAVAIGMILALKLSVKQGLCPQEELDQILAHYAAVGLPDSPLKIRKQWNVEAILEHFTHDKKARRGQLTFILSKGIGKAFITTDVSRESLQELLEETCVAA